MLLYENDLHRVGLTLIKSKARRARKLCPGRCSKSWTIATNIINIKPCQYERVQ
jgi:hypothetical protein